MQANPLFCQRSNIQRYSDKASRCKGPARGGNYFPSTFFFTLFQKMIKKFKVIRIKSRADIREKYYYGKENNSNRSITFYNLKCLTPCAVRERSQAVLSVNPIDTCSWRAVSPTYSSFISQATARRGAWQTSRDGCERISCSVASGLSVHGGVPVLFSLSFFNI